MKKKSLSIVVVFALALVMICVFMTGCKEKGLNIIFYDFETGDKVSVVNSIDDEEGVVKLTEAFIPGDDVDIEIPPTEMYSVLFEDPKDSTYDIWYKVAIYDGNVYADLDTEKMDKEYGETMLNMGFDNGSYFEMDITEEDFRSFLNNK